MPTWIVVLLVVATVYWAVVAYGVIRTVCSTPQLEAVDVPDPIVWPRVSIVVAACNEGESLGEATLSKLADGYPNLEVIVVNDRSSDDTGAVIERLAAQDPRVRPVHIDALPDGWLGKVHALHRGLKHATGDWILLSDADIHLRPGTLRRAVGMCLTRGLDHLVALPRFLPGPGWVDIAVAGFVRMILATGRLWSAGDPRSRAYVGMGAFNLVKREAWMRTRGFPGIRMEVADDMAVGYMLKRAGATSAFVGGRDALSFRFYPSLRAWFGSGERGMRLFGFQPALAVGMGLVLAALELVPFLALGTGHLLALPAVALALAAAVSTERWAGLRRGSAWMVPVASVLMIVNLLRAAVVTSVRGGVRWRNAFYSREALLRGRVVRFP